jgi:type VI secretion system secreted protein VgrG
VKLQFSWDRCGPADASRSCWVRVSQLWAGQGFGGLAIPRVGQEVIVEFLHGDPERPIVTGRVYNAEQRTPSPLPEGAAWTGIRSASTPGSGGHSEISIDDRAGHELLRVRAERDRRVHVGGEDELTIERGSRRVLVRAGDYALHAAQGSVELGAHSLLGATALQGIRLGVGASRIEIGPERIALRAGAGALIVGPAGVMVEGGLQECTAEPGAQVGGPQGGAQDSADPA